MVVEAYATGTKPDGVQYDTPFICVFETRDGLIVSMREYSDTRLTAEVPGIEPLVGIYSASTLISALFG